MNKTTKEQLLLERHEDVLSQINKSCGIDDLPKVNYSDITKKEYVKK